MSLTQRKPCRYGTMLYFRSDRYIGRSLDVYGEYCEGEAEIFRQLLAPGHIVVEVGANIGPHTIHLAQRVGPTGLVYAFEPQRPIFQLLCANLALNEIFNVRAFHAACGSEPGRLLVPPVDYSVDNSNFGGVTLLGVAEGEEVPVIALDTLALPAVRLLKIDVEGMELAVVTGARGLIRRHRPALYIENDRRDQSPLLIRLVEELGYDLWWHCPMLFSKDNFDGAEENVFGNTGSFNIMCLPKEQSNDITGFRKVSGPDDWWESAA